MATGGGGETDKEPQRGLSETKRNDESNGSDVNARGAA